MEKEKISLLMETDIEEIILTESQKDKEHTLGKMDQYMKEVFKED